MNNKHQRVLSFFNVEINQFILGDLEVLSHIRPHPTTQLGGCVAPQAMLIFSALDLLGYLTNRSPKAKKSDTKNNLESIFSSDLELFPETYKNATDEFVKLFRHGVVHQFFSKASGMGKYGLTSPVIISSGHIPTLNIDKFTEDFVNAVKKLSELIASGKHNDLVEQINNRLDILAIDDLKDLDKINKKRFEPGH